MSPLVACIRTCRFTFSLSVSISAAPGDTGSRGVGEKGMPEILSSGDSLRISRSIFRTSPRMSFFHFLTS